MLITVPDLDSTQSEYLHCPLGLHSTLQGASMRLQQSTLDSQVPNDTTI